MTDSNSPVEPNRAPKPNQGDAPAALRRRGIYSASEVIGSHQRLRAGSLIWLFYERALCERYFK